MISLKTDLIDCIWDNTNTYTHLPLEIPYPTCGYDNKLYWILTPKRIIYIRTFEDIDERPFDVSTKDLECCSVDDFITSLKNKKRLKELSKNFVFKPPLECNHSWRNSGLKKQGISQKVCLHCGQSENLLPWK